MTLPRINYANRAVTLPLVWMIFRVLRHQMTPLLSFDFPLLFDPNNKAQGLPWLSVLSMTLFPSPYFSKSPIEQWQYHQPTPLYPLTFKEALFSPPLQSYPDSPRLHSANRILLLGICWLLAVLALHWRTSWDLVLVGKLWRLQVIYCKNFPPKHTEQYKAFNCTFMSLCISQKPSWLWQTLSLFCCSSIMMAPDLTSHGERRCQYPETKKVSTGLTLLLGAGGVPLQEM
jgi:hypothetical protein